MPIYFPDSNFFLEFRKAGDLPWHELAGVARDAAAPVRLVVPSMVVTEIERHKSRGNNRLAKRARDASALFRQILTTAGGMVVLEDSQPQVTLELPPVVRADFSAYPNFDPQRPDHHIAAECAALLAHFPEQLQILTDDTLLVVAARAIGLAPLLLPQDWRLPPEKDERDDKIERLQNQLRQLENARPVLSFSLLANEHQIENNLPIETVVYAADDATARRCVGIIEQRHPMQRGFTQTAKPAVVLSAMWALGPPSAQAVNDYQLREYPKWQASLEPAVHDLIAALNEQGAEQELCLRLNNTGFANATQALVTITAHDGLLLHGRIYDYEVEDRDNRIKIPEPPEPPRPGYAAILAGLSGRAPWDDYLGRRVTNGLFSRKSDKSETEFYHVQRPKGPVDKLEYECAAVPHQIDAREIRFRLIADRQRLGPKPRLHFRAHASNMPKPIELNIMVAVTSREANPVGSLC